jgi:ornithine carbamoyltransferase
MACALKNRSFLTLKDFNSREISLLLDLAASLKMAKLTGTEQPVLKGKEIALIFEKSSTRTRVGFEVAAYDQGAHVTYLGPSGTQIGYKETMKDTARVLGRIYDAIEYRGFGQEQVETLARYSGVPVYNGLTDLFHPTQVLADFLTMREHVEKPLKEVSFCFIGDTSGNMADSLLTGAAVMGMDIRLCGPKSLRPDEGVIEFAQETIHGSHGKFSITDDIKAAVDGCDFIYTDVWVSMGEPETIWKERINLLKPYQVDINIMRKTGNPHVKFMHCLPAFHNAETVLGGKIAREYGLQSMEVTEEVFESDASIVFDQAENRMHTIKAVLVATLGN